MKRARSESEWRTLVQELESSGASAWEFAQRRGLNKRTVAWWRSYFRGRGRVVESTVPAVQFVAVKRSVEQASVSSKTGVTELAVFAGGVRIGVQPGFDQATLTALLDVLDARHEGRR